MYPLLVMREEKQHNNRTNVFIYLVTCTIIIGARGGVVVKALRYGFDSRWFQWIFQ